MSNAFCIIRCSKLKTRGNLGASIEHNFRTRTTINADPARTPLNRTIGAATKASIFEHLDVRLYVANQERIRLTGKKTQSNAVPVIEYLITASPEEMATWSAAKVDEFFADCQRWLVERHGRENVLSTTVQFDEGSPHMCAYVVPIAQRGRLAGTLSAAEFMDGPKKLSELQTSFAEKVGAKHGLERGIEGSKAKHDRVARHNALVNQAIVPLPAMPKPARAPKPGEVFREAVGLATEHSAEVERVAAAERERANAIDRNYVAAIAKGKQLEVERGKVAARDAQLREASFAREIPLDQVMAKLGCKQLARDKQNWETPAGRISIGRGEKGAKFMNQDTGVGGGGAIDLVMHVEGFDFTAAKRWLLDSFGGPALVGQLVASAKLEVERLQAEPRPPFEAPQAVPERWPKVRAYLVDVRRLAGRLVDALHSVGRIYADARSNAVFQLGPEPGVELRGTYDASPDRKPFKGVRGKKGVFDLAAAGDDRRVAFVESSIEVMSLRELGFEGRIVGFAGSSPDLQQIYAGELVAAGHEVLAAFNADQAGDSMAKVLQEGVPAVKRLRPASTKDWNAELVQRATAKDETEARRLQSVEFAEKIAQKLEDLEQRPPTAGPVLGG